MLRPLNNHKELVKKLHQLHRNDDYINNILSSYADEGIKLKSAVNQCNDERFLDTASEEGLKAYEYRLGIVSDTNKSIEQRRALVRARLRTKKKTSLSMIKSMAEAWIDGTVEASMQGSAITIKFTSIGGEPDNLIDLKNSIKLVSPCHLKLNWEFSYLTWDLFESFDWTWDEFESQDLTWDELERKIN